ncbi:TPA: hypothetical protein ACH3X1_007232 [Trebouxia sp. C0004]
MALTYALYQLSRSPLMQQRLVGEVDQFGREKEPAFADLAQFPFADAVFKEGTRLHPPRDPSSWPGRRSIFFARAKWAIVSSSRDLQPIQAAINMLSAVLGGFVQTREATGDVMLRTRQIPAGTRIWINVLSLHLDDKHFPNAKEFMPDRFLETDGTPSHRPYAYIPFGAGPRKCIGYK